MQLAAAAGCATGGRAFYPRVGHGVGLPLDPTRRPNISAIPGGRKRQGLQRPFQTPGAVFAKLSEPCHGAGLPFDTGAVVWHGAAFVSSNRIGYIVMVILLSKRLYC